MARKVGISKGEAAKARIVGEALKLFAKKGFMNTSFQEIATKAKMTQPGLFHYFDNKYALFEACIEQVLRNYQSILEKQISVEDHAGIRLTKNFLSNLEWMEKHPHDSALLIFLYYTATHDLYFKALYTRLLTRVRHRYAEVVHAGVRERLFKPAFSPEETAVLLHEQLLGALINFVASEREKDGRAKLLRRWESSIEAFVGWKPDFDQRAERGYNKS